MRTTLYSAHTVGLGGREDEENCLSLINYADVWLRILTVIGASNGRGSAILSSGPSAPMSLYRLLLLLLCVPSILLSQAEPYSAGILFPGTANKYAGLQLELAPQNALTLPSRFSLSFQLAIWDAHKYGNVFSLGTSTSFMSVLIYDEASNRDTSFFRLIDRGQSTGIVIPVPKSDLHRGNWFAFRFDFDLRSGSIDALVNGVRCGSGHLRPLGAIPVEANLIYGEADFPIMAVKNVELRRDNAAPLHSWKLSEAQGIVAHDDVGGCNGTQTSLAWLAPMHSSWTVDTIIQAEKWKLKKPNHERTWSVICGWKSGTQELHVFGKRSMSIVSFRDHSITSVPFQSEWSGELVFDDRRNTIYSIQPGGGKAGRYRSDKASWYPDHPYVDPDHLQFYATQVVNPLNGDILSLGGYGWYTYKNTLRRYNFTTEKWDTIHTHGEQMQPRTYCSTAEGREEWELLIYGGVGSLSGRQQDGEVIYNDLWSLDLRTYTFKKLWDKGIDYHPRGWHSIMKIPELNEYVYVNANPVPAGQHLVFSRGGLYSDSLEVIADTTMPPMDYKFYYDAYNRRIICLGVGDDKEGTYSRYILLERSYPFLDGAVRTPANSPARTILAGSLAATCLGAGFVFFIRRRKKKNVIEKPLFEPILPPKPEPGRSSIQLFGHFRAIDSAGKDITEEFTPKLLQLFVLILVLKNGNPGITTETLSTILWPESDYQAAKNVRGVTINKLRSVLEKIGGITIDHEHKRWRIVFGADVYCDYIAYKELKAKAEQDPALAAGMMRILCSGTFMEDLRHDALDEVKSAVHGEIIDLLVRFLRRLGPDESPDIALECCDCILRYDPLHTEAFEAKMRLLGRMERTGDAKTALDAYAKQYRDLLGKDYVKKVGDFMDDD
jgi:two-component SAPR family response regulator